LRELDLTVTSFGSGAASVLIQLQGPVLFVVPVILGGAGVGICLLWRAGARTAELSRSQQYAIVTLAFVGLWTTLSLPYYVNESFATGQLQTFLLPLGVCLCALLSLGHATIPQRKRGDGWDLRTSLNLWLLPLTLPIAVGLGAILQTPYPSTTLHALTHPPASHGFLGTVSSGEISTAKAYVRGHGGGAVGYFGPNANYVELADGLRPRILYDDPSDFYLGPDAHEQGCHYLRDRPTPWLMVLPGAETITLGKDIFCGGYTPLRVPGLPTYRLFRLRDPGA
jgi:hypothetical protein